MATKVHQSTGPDRSESLLKSDAVDARARNSMTGSAGGAWRIGVVMRGCKCKFGSAPEPLVAIPQQLRNPRVFQGQSSTLPLLLPIRGEPRFFPGSWRRVAVRPAR